MSLLDVLEIDGLAHWTTVNRLPQSGGELLYLFCTADFVRDQRGMSRAFAHRPEQRPFITCIRCRGIYDGDNDI